jgi:hypothetical protein
LKDLGKTAGAEGHPIKTTKEVAGEIWSDVSKVIDWAGGWISCRPFFYQRSSGVSLKYFACSTSAYRSVMPPM